MPTVFDAPAAGDPAHWTEMGMRLHSMGRYEDALVCADRVVALAPRVAVAWLNRGLTLEAMRRPADALASYDRALACEPADIAAWCGRAKALDELARLPEALDAAGRAIALDPASAGAWAQHGCTLAGLCRDDEAIASLDRAGQLAPGDPAVRVNRGLVRLRRGDLPGGWEDFEARADARRMEAQPLPGVPVWRKGEAVVGRRIALFAEQGAGDTIQFCRYAPLLARMGARVHLVVPPVLAELVATVADNVHVHVAGGALPRVDLQCLLGSMPHRCATTLGSIPARGPYLRAPRDQQARWRAALEEMDRHRPRPRVGLACSGSAGNRNDGRRSIALEQLAPLVQRTSAAGSQWHLVQNELRAADEPWLASLGIRDHRAALTDFAQTAALVACLDAVVSVDTSVAHLAGALGVPLYLLLPWSADWRWMLERSDSPWYPGARLYRQTNIGDWNGPVGRVAEALLAEIAAGTVRPSPLAPA